jgi:hypothetical protein
MSLDFRQSLKLGAAKQGRTLPYLTSYTDRLRHQHFVLADLGGMPQRLLDVLFVKVRVGGENLFPCCAGRKSFEDDLDADPDSRNDGFTAKYLGVGCDPVKHACQPPHNHRDIREQSLLPI